MNKLNWIACVVLTPLIFLSGTVSAETISSPEMVGISSERLNVMRNYVQQQVDKGKHHGFVTYVVRNGKTVDYSTYGYQDVAKTQPIQKNTIFRIFSMTKTITTVVAMQLLEEGKLNINDPVSQYIPEMSKLTKYVDGSEHDFTTSPVTKTMTIRHLMTHSAGLTYGNANGKVVDKIVELNNPLDAKSYKAFINKVVENPLTAEPGTQFDYGISIDVLGYIIEKIENKPLQVVFQDRIFKPLNMLDTGFTVERTKRSRLMEISVYNQAGQLVKYENPEMKPGEQLGQFPNAGGGLYSTAEDYAHFAQMLLNFGQYNNQHILGRKTVEFMFQNHLGDWAQPTHIWSKAQGFGLGGELRINQHSADSIASIGSFGWSGLATTYYRIDPSEKLMFMLLTQHFPTDPNHLFPNFTNTVYQTIID